MNQEAVHHKKKNCHSIHVNDNHEMTISGNPKQGTVPKSMKKKDGKCAKFG